MSTRRRSSRKRATALYDKTTDNLESKNQRNLTQKDGCPAAEQSQEEILKQQIQQLLQEKKSFHEALEQYVKQVKTSFSANDDQCNTEKFHKELKDSVAFLAQCVEDVRATHGSTNLSLSTENEETGDCSYQGDEEEEEEGEKVEEISRKKSIKSLGKKTTTASLTCEVCQRQFSTKAKLSAHHRNHFYQFQYKCDKCEKTFQFQSQLTRHQLSHTGEKAFKCEYCGKLFQGKQGLEKHVEKHLPVRPEYKCDVCGKVLGSKNYLQRHKRIHQLDNPFTCDVCGKGCIDSKTLHEHQRTHTGEKPFACDVCHNTFTRKSYLSQHIKTVHNRENRFQCDECGKEFSDKWYLNVHKQLHRPETPYLCDFCGKGYKNKYTLRSHKLTHTEKEPYICDVCGKGFKIKGGLKEHKKSHSDEKPHTCEICGKGFRDKNQLSSHKWVHEDERPFKCDVCGKSFPWKGRLDLHKRIHSAERPFNCDICGKGFKRKNDITKHKMKVHERRQFSHRKRKELSAHHLSEENQNTSQHEPETNSGTAPTIQHQPGSAHKKERLIPEDRPDYVMPLQNSVQNKIADSVMPRVIGRALETRTTSIYATTQQQQQLNSSSAYALTNTHSTSLPQNSVDNRAMQRSTDHQNLSFARAPGEEVSYTQPIVSNHLLQDMYVHQSQQQPNPVREYQQLQPVRPFVRDESQQQHLYPPLPLSTPSSSSSYARTNLMLLQQQGASDPGQTFSEERPLAQNAAYANPSVPYPWNSGYRDNY